MTSRETVWRTIRFQGPGRFAHDFPAPFGSDFVGTAMTPSTDARPSKGVDEWGAVWANMGTTQVGEVKEYPLADWADWDKLKIPNILEESRWSLMKDARAQAGDKFLLGYGVSLYERVHFIRGLENTWTDIYDEPERLGALLDMLVEMDLEVIRRYAAAGVDGLMFPDDWGLQDRLMISPVKWREIWKPRYERVYRASHEAGMSNWLHSCGCIVDILGDLIEVGLDVIHMDQQANMGLDVLGKRFGGRLTFYSPVDIQVGMQQGLDHVRQYARHMAKCFASTKGGFIPRWYTDPNGAGHSMEAVQVMCEEFLKISKEIYGA